MITTDHLYVIFHIASARTQNVATNTSATLRCKIKRSMLRKHFLWRYRLISGTHVIGTLNPTPRAARKKRNPAWKWRWAISSRVSWKSCGEVSLSAVKWVVNVVGLELVIANPPGTTGWFFTGNENNQPLKYPHSQSSGTHCKQCEICRTKKEQV